MSLPLESYVQLCAKQYLCCADESSVDDISLVGVQFVGGAAYTSKEKESALVLTSSDDTTVKLWRMQTHENVSSSSSFR